MFCQSEDDVSVETFKSPIAEESENVSLVSEREGKRGRARNLKSEDMEEILRTAMLLNPGAFGEEQKTQMIKEET